MKWLFCVFFGLVSLGIFGFQVEASPLQNWIPTSQGVSLDESNISLTDIDDIGSRRSRSTNSLQTRQKSVRTSDRIELPGSLFFSCRIWQSYIPIDTVKALWLRFGHAIQVNAP